MEVDRQLKLMALQMACQRLSNRVKTLARVGVAVNPTRLEGVDGLVTRALETLEKDAPAAPDPKAQKPPSAVRLMRMLRGKDLEEEPPSLVRSQDTPPTSRHTLGLRGQGDFVPVSELLAFLSAQRKNGILEVVTPAEVYSVEFRDSDIVHIGVNVMPQGHRLGDILVLQGAINRDMLEVTRKLYSSERLGEMLLRQRLVTSAQLYMALQTQTQLLFNRLFVAPMTRFSFWSGPPRHLNSGFRMSPLTLILEGARALDLKGGLKAKRA